MHRPEYRRPRQWRESPCIRAWSARAGRVRCNEGIAFAKFAQDSCNPAFAPWDLTGHFFLDELDFDEAVQDLRSPANRIGFPPTRGCRTTPASCPQNLRSGSSRKTGSRQIGNSPTSSAQNEILYGGIGTYVRLGPSSRPAPPIWVRPTCKPPWSTPPPRAPRRGIFWRGCGPGSRIRPDPAPEGLPRGPVTRMAWAMTRKVGPPCKLRPSRDHEKRVSTGIPEDLGFKFMLSATQRS